MCHYQQFETCHDQILCLCFLCVQLIMSHNKQSDKGQLEFGGVVGATFLVFGLPATVMAINIACNKVFIILHMVIANHICAYLLV